MTSWLYNFSLQLYWSRTFFLIDNNYSKQTTVIKTDTQINFFEHFMI